MNNFLDFILKDIETKTSVLATLPTKTKTHVKKYNATVEEYVKKYTDYKTNLKNYLLAKSRSFEVKNEEKTSVDSLTSHVDALEHVKFLLNPTNTYFEKMGFDELLFQLSNYNTFNFTSLNELINGFLDKFQIAGISLIQEDFDYTCYVKEYMASFLDVRSKKIEGHEKLSEVFEQIYWVNPDIIAHIELNFRKLIRKNAKKFESYIEKVQKEWMEKEQVTNYLDCVEKIKSAYQSYQVASKENVHELVLGCEKGEIDISSLLQESKVRSAAYEALVPETVLFSDIEAMGKVCTVLEKLEANVLEYSKYMEFEPLITAFKNEYQKAVTELPKPEPKKGEISGLKEVLNKIENGEQELEKLNRKISGTKNPFFDFKNEMEIKQLKAKSVVKAKELYELYAKYDEEYFKEKVLDILNPTLTVLDVLHLYSSFDYFKKKALQKAFHLTTYDDIKRYSESFDLFAMNPSNVIVSGILVFDETNIPKTIVNKYRLNGIKIDEMDLSIDNIQNLLNRIKLILRIHLVETSTLSVEKIWFMSQVRKLMEKEEQK